MKQQYYIVILDTPPVNVVTDTSSFSNRSRWVILAILSGKTEIEGTKREVKSLESVNANVVGTVMTMIPVDKKDIMVISIIAIKRIQRKREKEDLRSNKMFMICWGATHKLTGKERVTLG